MEDYKIKIDAFEGPMDLLMHLIEKNKIDIYDIPIAELTRQYLDYLDKFREFNMEIASSFLVMAATLLQIKSRMMLPKAPQAEGEPEEDPRFELVQRILEYREMDREHELLIAVQPTRGLDVGAIEYIHKEIVKERDAGKAILLVSLELDEVMNLSDRILVMYEGEIVGEVDPKKTTLQELGLYMSGAKRDDRREAK